MLLQATLLLVSALAIVVGARALLRRRLRGGGQTSVVDTVMEPLAGVYGLLLAFLVSGVADRTMQLRSALETESDAFQRARLITQRLPPPLNAELPRRLDLYAAAERAARQQRFVPDRSGAILNNLWLRVAAFEPGSASVGVLQAETLDQLRVLDEQRRNATRASRHAHGPLIWLVLIVGSTCVIAVCLLASLGDRGAQFIWRLW